MRIAAYEFVPPCEEQNQAQMDRELQLRGAVMRVYPYALKQLAPIWIKPDAVHRLGEIKAVMKSLDETRLAKICKRLNVSSNGDEERMASVIAWWIYSGQYDQMAASRLKGLRVAWRTYHMAQYMRMSEGGGVVA